MLENFPAGQCLVKSGTDIYSQYTVLHAIFYAHEASATCVPIKITKYTPDITKIFNDK